MNNLIRLKNIFWFNVILCFSGLSFSAPGDILFSESFDSTADFTSDWSETGAGLASVTTQTFNSSPSALAINGGASTVTSNAGNINANVAGVQLSVWIRRGRDDFSENPDANEDLFLQYLDDIGVWQTLESWDGEDTSVDIVTPIYDLPDDALHTNLQIRFVLTGGSGTPFDFWHVDDIVVTETFGANVSSACDSIFSNGIQSNNPSGNITLNQNATITGGDEFVDTTSLNIPGSGVSCNGTTCLGTGSTADSVSVNFPSFPLTNGDVTVNGGNSPLTVGAGDYGIVSIATNGGEISFSDSGSTYTMTNFLANNNNSIINLSPGDYYVQSTLSWNGGNIELRLSEPGTVRIFVQGTVVLGSNMVTTDFSSNPLLIYTTGNFSVSNNSVLNGYVYSGGLVSMANGSEIVGGVSGGSITMQNNSGVTYNPINLSAPDIVDFCTDVDIPNPIAEYRLEEPPWSGVAGEVLDNSGNDLHGVAVSSGGFPTNDITDPAISGDPGTCEYGIFNGTSDGYIEVADPGFNSILDLSTNYSVTVWINPIALPGSDLSTIVSKDENFEFHLNPSGQIFWWWGGGVRTLTSSSSITLGSWQHIAITYENGEQHIYIDGVSDATNNSTTAVTVNNDSLFIGTDLGILSRRFNGLIDEVRVYDSTLSTSQVNAVMLDSHPCTSTPISINSFNIDVGGGNASTCNPFDVTITALDSSGATLTSYTGTIDLTTSTNNGDWSGSSPGALGVLNSGASDSGTADYTFEVSEADAGQITLQLSNEHAETLTISVDDAANGVTATSSDITFSENAFEITANDSLGLDVIGNRSHEFQVQMIRRDSITTNCGVATNYNEPNVKAWITRTVSDPGGNAPQLTNSTGTDTVTLPNFQDTTEINLGFTSGTATFSLLTSDVGRYAINLLDDSGNFSTSDITGSSPTFTVRPLGFNLSVTGNPSAANENGSVFATAGSNITITAAAVGWSSTADADDNGNPDNHMDADPTNNASLSNTLTNPVLPSFGQEGETITLSSQLFAPIGGADPGLVASIPGGTTISSFTNGVGSTSNVFFPEVGIIEVFAEVSDGDYLDTGNSNTENTDSASGFVGRFIPSDFSITPTSIDASCGFSYMEEPFDVRYQIQANNTLGAVTTNYRDGFIKLSAVNISLFAIDELTPTPLNSRVNNNGSALSWSNGVATSVSSLNIERDPLASPDGPFNQTNIGVNLSDSDGVTLRTSLLNLDSNNDTVDESISLGQTVIRFGRLFLGSAFGPETSNLPVKFLLEYWDSVGWTTALDDSCSTIAQSAITYDFSGPGAGTIDVIGNRTITIGDSTTTGIYGNDSGGVINFNMGDAGHFFSAPGASTTAGVTNSGTFNVQVDISAYPWLIFDWNEDGLFNETLLPEAYYSFGTYRGHDRIIFWREVF